VINPQFGRAVNGSRAMIQIGGAAPVSAGIRVKGELLEVAYFGTAPSAAYPIVGTIDGVPARFLKLLDSAVPGMTVVQAVTAAE
jgi:hypothetical protein